MTSWRAIRGSHRAQTVQALSTSAAVHACLTMIATLDCAWSRCACAPPASSSLWICTTCTTMATMARGAVAVRAIATTERPMLPTRWYLGRGTSSHAATARSRMSSSLTSSMSRLVIRGRRERAHSHYDPPMYPPQSFPPMALPRATRRGEIDSVTRSHVEATLLVLAGVPFEVCG